MEKAKIIEQLNKAENIIDKLRADLLNEDNDSKKKKKKSNSITTKELASLVDLDGTLKEPIADEVQKKDFKELNSINQQLEVKRLLERYSCFNELEDKSLFIDDLIKIISNNNISVEQLDATLERVKYANDKQPKADIKKYTYSCLYNINRA